MSGVEWRFWRGSCYLQDIAMRALLLITIAVASAIVPIESAYANTRQCNALHRQLVSLPSGSNADYRKYDRAAKRQAAEISKAKKQRARANCGFLSGRKCGTLSRSIRKMETNYRKLIATRDRFGRSNATKRKSIERKIAALRCNVQTVKATTRKNKTTSIVVRRGEKLRPGLSTLPQLGGYRTMCVRTCDGYYFPVSHASTKSQLPRDESICNALCPASETRLYVHRNADQETEDMVSLRGEPYTQLPTAFKYRTQARNPSCSCGSANPRAAGLRLQDAEKLANVVPAKSEEQKFLESLPPPRTRPNLFADAETLADEASGLTPQAILRFVDGDASTEMQLSASTRKVRVVGPEFLPDPSTAIDLRAPAPTLVQ